MHQKFAHFIIFLGLFLGTLESSVFGEAVHEKSSINIVERKRKVKGDKSQKDYRGPSIDASEIYASKIEVRLIANIDKTIKNLESIARSLPQKSAKRGEILFRILGLCIEQAAYLSSQENRKYDQAFEAWDANNRQGTEPKLDSSQSRQHWLKVSDISSQLIKEFPRNPRSDVVAFNLAMSYQYLNQEKEAAKAFSDLIKRYQNSKLSGDAYYSLGEYYFDKTDFRNALNNYKSALRYKKSSRYGFALFKSGWCYFNMGDYRTALEKWKETIGYAKINGGKSNDILKSETLRDMVYAFSELGQVDQAINYFKANGGDALVGQFLKLLAGTYADQGKFAQSIDVYRRLQKVAPTSPDAPDAHLEIISLSYELGRHDVTWKELSALPKMYADGSPWAQKNDRKKVREVQISARDQILYYAKLTHKKAQDSDNQSKYDQARFGYGLFLANYPTAKESVEVKFNLGDILFLQKNFRDSGKTYLELTKLDKEKAFIFDEKGQRQNVHQKAARYMLDAYSQDFNDELKALMKEKPDASKPPRALSEKGKNFLAACGLYTKTYPQDLKTKKNCEVYAADIYLRINDKKEAKAWLWLVALRYSEEPEGKIAAENIIPLYKDDKKGMIEAAHKLASVPAFQKGDLGDRLRDLLQGAEVESVASESNTLKRADGWMKQANKYPKSKDAPKYLYNASVDFLKAGDVDRAVTAYKDIIEKYPQFDQLEEIYLKVAKIFDKQMEFAKAAGYYSAFAKRYPKSKEAGGSLERNCRLRIALAPTTAVSACEDVALYSKEVTISALEELIESLYVAKEYSVMISVINSTYLAKYQIGPNEKIAALYKIYVALKGNPAESRKYAREITSIFKSSPGKISGPSLRYVGEIAFSDTTDKFANYIKITLKGGSVAALKKSIDEKSSALDKLQTVYTEVAKIGDAFWGIAALHQIGVAFEQLGRQLSTPPGINGAPIEDVKKQLEPDAKGALSKAAEFYNAAQGKQKEFSVYNDYSVLLANSLHRIKGSNITFDDWVLLPDFLGNEIPEDISSKVQ